MDKKFREAQRQSRGFSEKYKRQIEERRLRQSETEDEGRRILRAEKLEKEGLHVDAIKCWLELGMKERAMEIVRKNHSELDVLHAAASHGLREDLREFFAEIGANMGKLQASNLAHAAGMQEEAYNLGLEHLATSSRDMPLAFQGKKGRKFAALLESEGNFGAAGRMYERLGHPKKAFRMYMKGGYPEEVAKILKDKWFVRAWALAKKAYRDAVERGKDEGFIQNSGGEKELYRMFVRQTTAYLLCSSLLAFSTGIWMAITISAPLGSLIVFSVLGLLPVSLCVIREEEVFLSWPTQLFSVTSSITKRSKEKPDPLPECPAVLSQEEAIMHSYASPQENAGRMLSAGMVYEAGVAYAKAGETGKAMECAEMLEKKDKNTTGCGYATYMHGAGKGKRKAREIKILIYGKTYLEAEELAKTDPDAANEMLSALGLKPLPKSVPQA